MIYVDDPMTINPRFKQYCHLWADDVEELHTFARRLGLNPEWFQVSLGITGEFPHYDISPNKRAQALKMGANYMPLTDWIKQRNPDLFKPKTR